MGSDEVHVARDGGVITLTLHRPADQNRLTSDVIATLQALADRLAGDEDAQVVVLTGGGREFFSMGILNPAVRASYTKAQVLDLVRAGNRLFDALEALPQIVIAALNGIARAGAAEMERLGLVLAVYPAERLLSEAHALARRIAASGPLAVRGAKRIVNMRQLSGFTAARTLSDTLRHALEWSRDVDEGMAAHREGRPPRFTGR
jgi:enoyl-CoA hydratase/carnithine racemase